MHFTAVSAPATNVSDDGQTVTIHLQDAQGSSLELAASYTALEDLSSALTEASARAHRIRRQRSSVDESVAVGPDLFVLTEYRFAVADDKSGTLLSLRTSIGPTEILMPADTFAEFVGEASQHLELLKAPRQTN